MRILSAIVLMMAPHTVLWACSCVGPGPPCSAAGISAAVFTGTVLEIVNPPFPRPAGNTGFALGNRRSTALVAPPLPQPLRIVRLRVGQVLTGVRDGQEEIEIVTGMGGGDCGYDFQTGTEYVVYAYKDSDGRLGTSICSRTRLLTEAAEDIEYFRALSKAPETSSIRVYTNPPAGLGTSGLTIVAERAGARYSALTNADGQGEFTGLPPGDYTIHNESDGDLSDHPKVELYAKGCLDVTLFRSMRITGRVMAKSGLPAARIEVQLRSTQELPWESAMTDSDGRYELRLIRAGRYYLGINLNNAPTPETPYPRWFHPGTQNPALATRIEFSGTPEVRNFDLILPD